MFCLPYRLFERSNNTIVAIAPANSCEDLSGSAWITYARHIRLLTPQMLSPPYLPRCRVGHFFSKHLPRFRSKWSRSFLGTLTILNKIFAQSQHKHFLKFSGGIIKNSNFMKFQREKTRLLVLLLLLFWRFDFAEVGWTIDVKLAKNHETFSRPPISYRRKCRHNLNRAVSLFIYENFFKTQNQQNFNAIKNCNCNYYCTPLKNLVELKYFRKLKGKSIWIFCVLKKKKWFLKKF